MEVTVLSDIHAGGVSVCHSSEETILSRFEISICNDKDKSFPLTTDCIDDDGDLIVPRKKDSCRIKLLLIEHALSTTLRDVGQQVWRGALLLGDYLLYHRDVMRDSVMLEFGGGVGLVSIVASQFCKTIFCTDTGKSILNICQRNVQRNADTPENVLVRELNWHTPFQKGGEELDYQWQFSDWKILEDVQYILAADVIYEDELTDSFMNCLVQLNHSKLKEPAVSYIAIEKRINFTLEDMAPAVPAYRHFRACLDHVYTVCGDTVKVYAEAINLSNIPRYFEYDRVNEMELMEVKTLKCKP